MTDAVDVFLGDVKCALERFEPKPGDVFVLSVPGPVSAEFAKRLQDNWDRNFPYKVLVVSDGLRIKGVVADGGLN